MNTPAISTDIVEKRREKAEALAQISDHLQNLTNRIRAVDAALGRLADTDIPKSAKGGEDIARLLTDLEHLNERVEIRRNRFQQGLITVSIAGLEKAGKTTFLKSLTGIEALPAFDERCTAVCCEIHYSEERSDFDIEFYSETEFLDHVIRPIIETVAAALPEDAEYDLHPPRSAKEFGTVHLPPADALPGGTTAYKLLTDLRRLQEFFSECRRHLGAAPLLRRPLTELDQWVSHRRANVDKPEEGDGDEGERGRHLARTASVKTCRIHSKFAGGSPHLRWIDTPGVDDPNRRAREQTLATIASETDLLAVASRPGANPSPGESFHRFWDSVTRQPDEIDLMNRMLFVLNHDRRVDAKGENIRIHRKYLTDAGVPGALFAGPYEAVRPEDAAALMERVNAHLREHLPGQDDQAILKLQTRLKHLQARTRLLHDALKRSRPADAGQQDMETEAFHQWFHWYRGDRDSGFWTDLVASLDRATHEILDDPRIRESESTLSQIFAEEAKKIEEQIPSPAELQDYVVRQRGENPIPSGMRSISTRFSRLVNRLASEIQEFGPIMQDKLVQVLAESGLTPLLTGKTAHERLEHLIDRLDLGRTDGESPVIEVLKETLELPRNLKYVIRYELRAAVDFCDPTLWNSAEEARNRLTEMIKANAGDASRLGTFDSNRHPPVTDSRDKDYAILKKIAGNAMLAIHSALSNERYLPRRIADDFMRDCRVRLCFGPASEQEWRTLLFRSRGVLLAGTIGKIRAESERIQAFRTALNELETVLP